MIILNYHAIYDTELTDEGADVYRVTTKAFEQHMAYLGHRRLVDDRVDPSAKPADDNDVILTFDDGYKEHYTLAFDLLKKYRMAAIFFVVPAYIGTQGYMDWPDLKEMLEAGMAIGSHGYSHRILTGLKKTDLEFELRESKLFLEDKLGTPVDYFSVPRGFHDRAIIKTARIAGYRAVFTSDLRGDGRYTFGRLAVKGNWSFERFISLIEHGVSLKEVAKESLKNTAKKVFGAARYDMVRTRILRRQKNGKGKAG